MLQGKTRYLCNDSSKKSCFCRGAKSQRCQSQKCIMNNLSYSENINEHNPDMCYFEQKKINLWEKYFK